MKYNRSEIMKRAWIAYKKRLTKNLKIKITFSSSLKWSWKIAKENKGNSIEGYSFKFWSKLDDMKRFYFNDNSYIQINIFERKPKGYYEHHRYCKGERFSKIFMKAYGKIASILLENNRTEVYNKLYAVA